MWIAFTITRSGGPPEDYTQYPSHPAGLVLRPRLNQGGQVVGMLYKTVPKLRDALFLRQAQDKFLALLIAVVLLATACGGSATPASYEASYEPSPEPTVPPFRRNLYPAASSLSERVL